MIPRFQAFTITLLASLFTACDSHGMRYKAEPQPAGAYIYADYFADKDTLTITIDADGRKVEDAWIKKSDGTMVQPLTLAASQQNSRPTPAPSGGPGNMMVPGGVPGGAYPPPPPQQTRPLTIATFSSLTAGPAPWELHVKAQGVAEATIPGMGGPDTAK